MLPSVLAVLIGLSLGILGGGGSILTVPVLLYAAQLPPKDAIATSLLIVGVTSFAAMLLHARRGRVAWRIGGLFGLSSMLGAYAGGSVAHLLPSSILLAAFTLMMALTGIAMLRPHREGPAPSSLGTTPAMLRAAGVGMLTGALTGVIGAGGGFVIVPALVFFSGLPMRSAIGTSLLVIALNSFAGCAGALSYATISWSLAAGMTVASTVGSLIGAALANCINPQTLRHGFAGFVLVVAAFMVARQLPAPVVRALAAHLTAVITVGGIVTLGLVIAWLHWRRSSQEHAPVGHHL